MDDTEDPATYEVAVVGGGPAGLSTALYTTRLSHDTVLIDRGGGRAAMMQDTHNVVGVTEDVSGNEYLQTGKEQIEAYGGDVVRGFVEDVEEREDGRFHLDAGEEQFVADAVVIAAGFSDERPDPPLPRTGQGLHYCLHCDAYMFVDESVYVMGHGDSAAHVAMIMLNFTSEVDILLRGEEPTWSAETQVMVENHPVDVIEADVTAVNNGEDGWLASLEFEDGEVREYKGGFALYGSNYNTDLPEGLGCDRNDDGTVAVDDHGRTSVDGVYAVGDITPGHNQVPVAIGEGAKVGIAIHMALREFPRSAEAIEADGPVTAEDVPGMSDRLRGVARSFNRDEREAEAAADD